MRRVTVQQEDLDLDTLRRKYQLERDKRLTADGAGTYTLLKGKLEERYGADPWTPSSRSRKPVSWDLEALIVGGGFAGMFAGGMMRKHGVAARDLCIVEGAADFGGTWYWNRYPGLSCDTESYCYLPLLEETGYVPKEKYSFGPELLEHSQRVGRHFALYERALFQTRVIEAIWDEERARWIAKTNRGDELRARYLWLCGGATNRPKLPGTPGIADFRGHSFHTMRWDYQYTGGGPMGHMVNLKDKRVGVVGTGCTAIQCIPPLGEWAKELYVFQRTPSPVNVRGNRPTDPDWASKLKPGWQLHRMENFLSILSGAPQEEDLVADGWTQKFKDVRHYKASTAPDTPAEMLERVDFELMQEVRARVDELVQDPETAEALKPWYGLLCKRMTFHDSYLQTFNRPNVTLVDTKGRGIERITENGIVANGREYELDCIIYATGFDISSGLTASLEFEPQGEGGVNLAQRWAREITTLHGLLISSFPNMFFIGGLQGALATTRTYDISVQTEHCARIVEHCRTNGIAKFAVNPEAEKNWQAELAARRLDLQQYFQDCTPSYFNGDGKYGPVWDYFYGGGPVEYRSVLEKWRKDKLDKDLSLERR
jgi:cyclohexanone monooxygenase